ncbi:class I SAM-dependent methyltransferase [Anoxynatronum buryatiense]|uniref:Methyltransferase domain-containing protein n=1 Tax=Anoxynatronum buryatiense TaxID=489973 RepID=A0AA45WWA3_9CLOT|nr:class I SAM-dependent methyltransferase [Anoxynatronum buryatiense]SMP52570.1 Methyltransferase domain-containing protein [Anoxynatronum buryatiense]
MRKAILFGASKQGEHAYDRLKSCYKIIAFCDSDKTKWGKKFCGVQVISPKELIRYNEADIIITSSYYREIQSLLDLMGFDYSVFNYNYDLVPSSKKLTDKMKIVDFGKYLSNSAKSKIEGLSFLTGGSSLLDYICIFKMLELTEAKTYLEIGTWTGESLAIASEYCEKCYSISLPDDDESIVRHFDEINNKDNFSRFFTRNKSNIEHYCSDSRIFDFAVINDSIDVVFIDGDHSFEGVKTDTANILKVIDFNRSIIIWHDFTVGARKHYRHDTIRAVYDSMPDEYHENIFYIDMTMCGAYIPSKYLSSLPTAPKRNEITSFTFEYDCKILKK